jgi:bleomycin hydrolase
MNKIASLFLIMALLLCAGASFAQQKKDKASFREYKNEFWGEISKSIEDYNKTDQAPAKKTFKMDFEGLDIPKSKDDFKLTKHLEPVSQGNTGTCWCFSATSFLESEISRIQKKDIKLSEMFVVYWQYVEKARRFVSERGNSVFGEGAQANAVWEMWNKYGCVPGSAYTGLQPGQKHHNHSIMFAEMNNYLQNVKTTNAWNEDEVIATIKNIMNHYLGVPPAEFEFEGKKYTPVSFLKDVVRLNSADYVSVMSLMEQPYFSKAIYDVPDNWWRSHDYENVPLEDFMNSLKALVKSGYSVVLAGDVSESGLDANYEVAMVPSYDIPSDFIDENARQLRFTNGSTTDDHGIHEVGYLEKNGKMWFLIKDSGSGGFNGTNKGYSFFHEDYIKLKIMVYYVHRDAVKDLLKKMKAE